MAKGYKTGGRKAGTQNRATAAKAEEIAASGLTPLDYMLTVMRDGAETPERRLDAAKAAAPFVHPKLAAVQHSGEMEATVRYISPMEEARRVAFLLLSAQKEKAGQAANSSGTH